MRADVGEVDEGHAGWVGAVKLLGPCVGTVMNLVPEEVDSRGVCSCVGIAIACRRFKNTW